MAVKGCRTIRAEGVPELHSTKLLDTPSCESHRAHTYGGDTSKEPMHPQCGIWSLPGASRLSGRSTSHITGGNAEVGFPEIVESDGHSVATKGTTAVEIEVDGFTLLLCANDAPGRAINAPEAVVDMKEANGERVASLVQSALTSAASNGKPGNTLRDESGSEDRLNKLSTNLDKLLQSKQGKDFDKIDAVLKNIQVHDDILRRKVDSKLIADVIEVGPFPLELLRRRKRCMPVGDSNRLRCACRQSLDERALKQRIRELNDELLMSSKWESARLSDLTKLAQDKAHEAQIQITKSTRELVDRQLKQDLKRVQQSGIHQRGAAGTRLEFSAKARRKAYLHDQFELMKANLEGAARYRLLGLRTAEKERSGAEVGEKTNVAAAKAVAGQVAMRGNEGDMTTLKAMYGRYAVWEKKSTDLLDLSGAVSDLDIQLHSGRLIANTLHMSSVNAVACEFGGTIARLVTAALISAGTRGDALPTREQLRCAFEAVVKPAARAALYIPTDQLGAAGHIIGRVRSAGPGELSALAFWKGCEGNAQSAEGALQRVSSMLRRGDLGAAVEAAKDAECLGSAASAPLADWINDAMACLAAEEAAVLLFTHRSILNSRMVAHS